MTTTDPAFDHLDGTLSAREVRRAHAHMREACPVMHSDRHGGFDYLTRYDNVRAGLTDPGTFSSADGVHIPPSGLLPPVPALEFDEPEHSQWRRVLDGPLTLRAVREFEPVITEVVDLLIDDFAAVGTADLASQLTEPLPAIVIGRMIGLDQAEAVRARGVAASLFARTLRRPVRVGDQELAEGGRVLLDLAAANRDPREFADPDEFDPRRTRNRHVSFGAGPHVCQGQHLARAELRSTLSRLLDRLPDLRLDGEPVESGLIGGSLMTHVALPAAFTPETGT